MTCQTFPFLQPHSDSMYLLRRVRAIMDRTIMDRVGLDGIGSSGMGSDRIRSGWVQIGSYGGGIGSDSGSHRGGIRTPRNPHGPPFHPAQHRTRNRLRRTRGVSWLSDGLTRGLSTNFPQPKGSAVQYTIAAGSMQLTSTIPAGDSVFFSRGAAAPLEPPASERPERHPKCAPPKP